jgi:AbiV family abortive infection protein
MSSQVTQYRGALTPEQASEGIALARANASRLIADAELLLDADRHPSAIALAILAIEELGKVQIIKMIVLHSEEAALKKSWREYRSHRAKNVQWIIPSLAAGGARTLIDLKPATDIEGEHTAMLDTIKQLAFYTDCLNASPHWSAPVDVIDPEFAESIIAVAKLLNRDRVTEVKELELWVELFGPYYDKPGMVEALLRFQQRMVDEGLTDTPVATMEAFVRGQPIAATSAETGDGG